MVEGQATHGAGGPEGMSDVIVQALALTGSGLALVVVVVLGAVTSMYVRRGLWAVRVARERAVSLALVATVVREAAAQLRIIAWTLLRRGSGHTQRSPHATPTSHHAPHHATHQLPVVLVHGLAADGASMWALRRALTGAGRPTWAPHLGPVGRAIEHSAARLAPVLRAAIATCPAAGGVDVVCHSMGGVVLRACLATNPDLTAHIRAVVCIASPHQGTEAASGIPLPEARQLARGSPWLTALPSLRALLPTAHITTIASRHDAVVYPHDTSRVDDASEHELDHLGHAELLTHTQVVRFVVAALAC